MKGTLFKLLPSRPGYEAENRSMHGWMVGIFCALLWNQRRAVFRSRRVTMPENSIHVASNIQEYGLLPKLVKMLHRPADQYNIE